MVACAGSCPASIWRPPSIPYERLAELEVRMADFLAALREVEPSAMREVFTETPNVKWEDVGGMESVKAALREAVEWPLSYAPLFAQAGAQPAKGILLAGPPGCGKTLLAKAMATESGVNFISVKGRNCCPSASANPRTGSGRSLRRRGRQLPASFSSMRSTRWHHAAAAEAGRVDVSERVVSQLLTELDGIEELMG